MSEIEIRRSPTEPASPANPAPAGHNGGPPLDEHTPEWGNGGIGNYFYWKAAHRAAWKNPSPGIVAFRIQKPSGWASPTKNTRWKFSNAAVTCRSRMSNGLQRSSRRAPPVRLPIGTPQKALHSPGAIFMPDIQIKAIALLARYLRDAQ